MAVKAKRKVSAIRERNKDRSLANLIPWKKGQSGNPHGAPKRGESWAELIKAIGDKTPVEAGKFAGEVGERLAKYGDAKTLKEMVILRVYDSLLFEPQPGLLNAFMERAEGKVKDSLELKGSIEIEGLDRVLVKVYGNAGHGKG